jgi:hypothetical protein
MNVSFLFYGFGSWPDFLPTAGVGISLSKDKLGNHVVKKLAKGWPADESGQIQEKVMPETSTTRDTHLGISFSTTECIRLSQWLQLNPSHNNSQV